MILFLSSIYITGFMSTLALMKARQQFESTGLAPEDIHNKLSYVVRDMNACYNCSGSYYLTDDNKIKSVYVNGWTICESHNLQRYNIEHNVTKKEFVTEPMLFGSIFWPFTLPVNISALMGKYTGNLLYQKNLVNRFEVVRNAEATDKYLTAANIELEDYIKRVDKGLDNTPKGI